MSILRQLVSTFSRAGSHDVTRWRFFKHSHWPSRAQSRSNCIATSAWPWPIATWKKKRIIYDFDCRHHHHQMCFFPTDGRTDGRTDGLTDWRTDGRTDWRTDGRASGRMDGRTDGRASGRMDGRTDRDRRTDELIDRRTYDIILSWPHCPICPNVDQPGGSSLNRQSAGLVPRVPARGQHRQRWWWGCLRSLACPAPRVVSGSRWAETAPWCLYTKAIRSCGTHLLSWSMTSVSGVNHISAVPYVTMLRLPFRPIENENIPAALKKNYHFADKSEGVFLTQQWKVGDDKLAYVWSVMYLRVWSCSIFSKHHHSCVVRLLTEYRTGALCHGRLQPVAPGRLNHEHLLERRQTRGDLWRQLLLTLAARRVARP